MMSLFGKRPVLIMGCGPAGLFAAQAAQDRGYPVVIFSRKRPSQMFGAQYLHGPIPNLYAREFTIEYILQGNAYGYAAKVYGPENAGALEDDVSPSRLLGIHKAWDIREAYTHAWERFEPLVVEAKIDHHWLDTTVPNKRDYALVVSSIPTDTLCRIGAHQFASADIWAVGDAPERDISCPVRVGLNTVVCNGEPSPSWYRASNVGGYHSAEWPARIRPPLNHISKVSKPIHTNCTCWVRKGDLPVPFIRVGRYGTWTKGVLSHDAYHSTYARLS